MTVREVSNKEMRITDIEPIKGFRVMEWLRGVRDANYELFVNDPEAYQKKLEEASVRMYATLGKQKQQQEACPRI